MHLCCDSNNSKRQATWCFNDITERENRRFWRNVFDVNQALVIYKITQIALDHENSLEISFLAFYFLPHFFHGIEVDAGHFQAAGGDNEKGWEFVSRFIANLDGKIQDSSGNCHKLVASGEYAIGVTIEKSAVLYADNADIGFLYPAQDSAVPDGVALVKGCPNEENAKLFIDFVTGFDCQKDQNVNWKRRPVRSDLQPEGLSALTEIDLLNYDFNWAATNKGAIIEKWQDLVVQ